MPVLLLGARQRPAQTQHAWPLLPGLDALALLWFVQREPAEDAELVRVFLRCLDGHLIGARIPAWRMQYRAIHPRRVHLLDQLLGRIDGRLPMMPAWRAAAPD